MDKTLSKNFENGKWEYDLEKWGLKYSTPTAHIVFDFCLSWFTVLVQIEPGTSLQNTLLNNYINYDYQTIWTFIHDFCKNIRIELPDYHKINEIIRNMPEYACKTNGTLKYGWPKLSYLDYKLKFYNSVDIS